MKNDMEDSYFKRQTYMMSNLGLFYIILIALFAIPLLGTFVVVLIKGVLSFQYVILGAGVILGGLLIFYGGKLCFRLYRKIREDGIMAVREAQARAGQGEPVQIAFFNGLFTFSSGGWKGPQAQALPHHQGNVALLPEATGGAVRGNDSLDQLRALSELKKDGVIDEEEFRMLKQKLIRDVCGAGDGSEQD